MKSNHFFGETLGKKIMHIITAGSGITALMPVLSKKEPGKNFIGKIFSMKKIPVILFTTPSTIWKKTV
jgi:hypothetical protein